MANEATAVDILRQARQLLAKPNGWTKGWAAQAEDGTVVGVRDKSASKFCASGAVIRAAYELGVDGSQEERAAMVGYSSETPFPFLLTAFNDSQQTIQPVIEAFDRAITKLSLVA
jgi:hypothetical protein